MTFHFVVALKLKTLHFVVTLKLKTVIKKSDRQLRRSGAASYPTVT